MKYNLSFVSKSMLEQTQEACSQDYYTNRGLQAREYINAIILPVREGYDGNGCLAGGVVTAEGNFVENSAFAETKGYGYNYSKIGSEVDEAIYVGSLLNIFGHTFNDNVKKLWYLESTEAKESITRGAKIVYVTTGNRPLASYAVRFMELAGFDTSQWLHITQATRCKRCIVPDDSFGCKDIFLGGYYTHEFSAVIEKIKRSVLSISSGVNTPKKVYFSRTAIADNSWREMGEACVEQVFRRKGFSIIHPEHLSLEEQLLYLMNAREFAATEGSISHGSIFCSPGTKVFIVRKVNQVNHYQLVFNQLSDVRVTYIDAHQSVQANKWIPNFGPFYLYPTPELIRFNGHYIWHLPLSLRPSWWWYNLRNRRIVKKLLFKS